MKAALFDYGAGNLHSLSRALLEVGLAVRVDTDAARAVRDSDLLVLPGVGAFGQAAERIGGARAVLHDALVAGHPCVGICLGMQLLFASSEEGSGSGIRLLEGSVTRLTGRRLPHMGWSRVGDLGEMYFAHTYVCRPIDPGVVTGWASHEGESFAAIVRTRRTVGVQFHPEKSSKAGLGLLSRLCGEVLL
jgi:imidazole glycerol-phosphate synthase subunit HisH